MTKSKFDAEENESSFLIKLKALYSQIRSTKTLKIKYEDKSFLKLDMPAGIPIFQKLIAMKIANIQEVPSSINSIGNSFYFENVNVKYLQTMNNLVSIYALHLRNNKRFVYLF